MEQNHHWGWMFVVLIIFGVSTYVFTLNRPEEYNKGSIHAEQHRQDWPFSVHIGEGGCATLRDMKKYDKRNADINTVKH